MGTIALYCQTEELVEAAREFGAFEGLDIAWQRITILEQLAEIKTLEGVVIENSGDALAAIQEARAIREGRSNTFLPIILLLPGLDTYHRALCFDLEYILPCVAPLQSLDFIPSLKKLVLFSRKRRHLMDLRERISLNMQQKQFDKVGPLLETYAKQDSEPFRATLLKAKLHLEMKDYPNAILSCASAVRENSRSLDARLTLAVAYTENSQIDKAREVIDKSLSLAPGYPPFLSLKARWAVQEGKIELGLSLFEESLNSDPHQSAALAGKLVAEALLNRADSVRSMLGSGQLQVTRLVQSYALDLARANKVGEAEKILQRSQQVLGEQPDSYKVWMNMGLHARRLQNWQKALSFFKACAANAPADYDKVHPYLAEAKKMLQKKTAAA